MKPLPQEEVGSGRAFRPDALGSGRCVASGSKSVGPEGPPTGRA
ncbi:DUF6053 domain-containing protein [Lysobacter yananisis]